jgi:hypothetical protein
MVVMVIRMHLVLINNNTTASISDEKTLSSFLLYLRAYSLDGVSIGTAFFFFVFSLFAFFLVLFFMKLQTHIHIFFPSPFHCRALGRSMLDNDDDHFACNLYCFLFFSCSLTCSSLVRLTFLFSLSFERPRTYAHTQAKLYLICATQLRLFFFFSSIFFLILLDGETRASLFDFSSFSPASTARTACFIHYSHICVRMQRMMVEREHNHQCDEDEDTNIIRCR